MIPQITSKVLEGGTSPECLSLIGQCNAALTQAFDTGLGIGIAVGALSVWLGAYWYNNRMKAEAKDGGKNQHG